MGLLDKLILPPSTEHLALLKYLIVLLYLIHIPFVSMLIGGVLFSILFDLLGKSQRNATHLRFSKELIHTFAQHKSVGLALGVLPLLTLSLIYMQILQGADVLLPNMLFSATLVGTAGFILVYVYREASEFSTRSSGSPIGAGILGLFLLLGTYLVFTSATSLAMDPEKWSVIRKPSQTLFSWNVVVRYIRFLLMAFTISGVGILFFLARGRDLTADGDGDYLHFVKRFGASTALVFLLAQPLFVLWQLVSLPKIALSGAALLTSAIVLVLMLVLALLLSRLLQRSGTGLAAHIFVLTLFLLLAGVVSESASRASATRRHTEMLIAQAEELEEERMLARGIEGGAASAARGEEIFKQRCSTCHRLDRRLVGPALLQVLPKYAGNKGDLMAFIRAPSRINPDYPAMPKLGLKELDIDSVATYLLEQLSPSTEPEGAGEGTPQEEPTKSDAGEHDPAAIQMANARGGDDQNLMELHIGWFGPNRRGKR